jgi:hypothetical protein
MAVASLSCGFGAKAITDPLLGQASPPSVHLPGVSCFQAKAGSARNCSIAVMKGSRTHRHEEGGGEGAARFT